MNGDARVTSADANAIAGSGYGGLLPKPELCDVTGNGACDMDDYFAVQSAVSSPPGDLQHCLPATAANVPATGAVELIVNFDGMGRLTSQTGSLGGESVDRSFTYDGLSRLKTATGPWEQATGATGNVVWTYSYDALGNLRSQSSSRSPSSLGDNRTWGYTDPARPRALTAFAQGTSVSQAISLNAFGEASFIDHYGEADQPLTWNVLGKLYQTRNSTYSWDAFDENTLVVTGPSGSQSSIVRAGGDFEYDVTLGRAMKYFSVGGIRIAALATSYTASSSAALPPAVTRTLRRLEPLAAPMAAGFLLLGMMSLVSIAARRRTPVWLSAPGVTVLSLTLVALPYQAHAATLSSGPGNYGRPAEPFLAYITDHLGSVRAVVNRYGIVVDTRDYDPFGADIRHVGAFSVQHRFTGQPADEQAGGLYNYGARFYNAKWGRFISPDEVVPGFDSQGLNPFAYVLNRSTSLVDPSGNIPAVVFQIGARVTGQVTATAGLERAIYGGPPTGRETVLYAVAAAGAVFSAALAFAVAPAALTVTAAAILALATLSAVHAVAAATIMAIRYYSVQIYVDPRETAEGSSKPMDSASWAKLATGEIGAQSSNGATGSAETPSESRAEALGDSVTIEVGQAKLDVDTKKDLSAQRDKLGADLYSSGFSGNVAQAISIALWAANIGW